MGSGHVACLAALTQAQVWRVITQMALFMGSVDDQTGRHLTARLVHEVVEFGMRGEIFWAGPRVTSWSRSRQQWYFVRAARVDCRVRNAVMRMQRTWMAVIRAWVW